MGRKIIEWKTISINAVLKLEDWKRLLALAFTSWKVFLKKDAKGIIMRKSLTLLYTICHYELKFNYTQLALLERDINCQNKLDM